MIDDPNRPHLVEDGFTPIDMLLVEHEIDDVDLILHALKKYRIDVRIFWAKDGIQAEDFIFCEGEFAGRTPKNGPKVMLMDARLAKKYGLDVLARIRQDKRTRGIPVVLEISTPGDIEIREGYKLGANSCVMKDTNYDVFAATIAETVFYWTKLNTDPLTPRRGIAAQVV